MYLLLLKMENTDVFFYVGLILDSGRLEGAEFWCNYRMRHSWLNYFHLNILNMNIDMLYFLSFCLHSIKYGVTFPGYDSLRLGIIQFRKVHNI
jgi:hypothetical protein